MTTWRPFLLQINSLTHLVIQGKQLTAELSRGSMMGNRLYLSSVWGNSFLKKGDQGLKKLG
jgi:hypothetical protein